MRLLPLLVLVAACQVQAGELAPRSEMVALSEEEMADVSGWQGVLLEINLRNNVSASNTPIGCTAVVGTPNPCRLGIEFTANSDTWLMLKEFYGTFELKELRMDAALLPATNTAYYDPARFRDGSGNDLIPGANPVSDPAIMLGYPGADAQGTYNDFLSFMNIGRTWLEFGTTAPVTPGYNRDTSLNSVLGVRMSDSSALNASSRMRFLGTGYVYGF